jgi:hypothetical protein
MSADKSNYGVQIGGSAQVNAGAIAGGPGASATAGDVNFAGPTATDLAELRDLLSGLAELLREQSSEIDDADGLQQITATAQQEARKDRPNMHVLGGLLQALMAGAGNVTVVANAISAIQHIITSFT